MPRARWQEEGIVSAPHGEQRRPVLAEVGLEFGVEGDVARIIAEEVQLRFVRAGTGHVEIVKRITVGRDRRHIAYAVRILPVRCLG